MNHLEAYQEHKAKRDGWYAVRTKPGSQMPRRSFSTEPTPLGKNGKPRGKGYRLVRDLNPELSAVENALADAGFDCYMPAERRLQRDRRRPFLWKPRRFAMMVGYIFVRDPKDTERLEAVEGVQGLVRDGAGRPLIISIRDILSIRAIEAKGDFLFDQQSKHARWKLRKLMKDDPEIKRIVEHLDIAGKLTVPLSELTAA